MTPGSSSSGLYSISSSSYMARKRSGLLVLAVLLGNSVESQPWMNPDLMLDPRISPRLRRRNSLSPRLAQPGERSPATAAIELVLQRRPSLCQNRNFRT